MILPKKNIFSKHQNKTEIKNLHDSEVLSSDFLDLRTLAASVTSTASTTSVASMTFTVSFHQKSYWSGWLDQPWHQNDQYWSLFVECIIKSNFSLIHISTFSVEDCWGQFMILFKNWLMKLKCPNLLKPLLRHHNSNRCWSLYPSEPFSFIRFNMRHPLVGLISLSGQHIK